MPDTGRRVVIFSLILFSCQAYMFKLVLRHGERHFATRFFALLIFLQAGMALARAVLYMQMGDNSVMASSTGGQLNTAYYTLSNLMSLIAPVAFMTVATHRLQTVLEQRSNHDPLTGALNRRGFMERYQSELARMLRDRQAMALLSIDLDYFKSINDRFGHSMGDRVLKHVTAVIVDAIRELDCVARFGGEEFIVLLPATKIEEARRVAERIQLTLRETPRAELPGCTVSIGIACQHLTEQSLDNMLAMADAALYRAKAAGRDRIEIAQELVV
jgi:diguanylate cyclase (GGDEF)-like protein